jgi:hypothetical protein
MASTMPQILYKLLLFPRLNGYISQTRCSCGCKAHYKMRHFRGVRDPYAVIMTIGIWSCCYSSTLVHVFTLALARVLPGFGYALAS